MSKEQKTNINDIKAKLSGKGTARFDVASEATPEREDKVVPIGNNSERFSPEKEQKSKTVIAQKKREDYPHEKYKGPRTLKSWRIRDEVLKKLTQIEKLHEFTEHDFVTTEFIEASLDKAFDNELKRLEKNIDAAVWELVKKQFS